MYGSPNYWNATALDAPEGFVLNERLVCHVKKHKAQWRRERLGEWAVEDTWRGIYGWGDSIKAAKVDFMRCLMGYWDDSIGHMYQTGTQYKTQRMLMALMAPSKPSKDDVVAFRRWQMWAKQRQHDHITQMVVS